VCVRLSTSVEVGKVDCGQHSLSAVSWSADCSQSRAARDTGIRGCECASTFRRKQAARVRLQGCEGDTVCDPGLGVIPLRAPYATAELLTQRQVCEARQKHRWATSGVQQDPLRRLPLAWLQLWAEELHQPPACLPACAQLAGRLACASGSRLARSSWAALDEPGEAKICDEPLLRGSSIACSQSRLLMDMNGRFR
jgi:hypothetical protein